MSEEMTEGRRRAELYVRSLMPPGARDPQAAVLDRLSALEGANEFAEISTRVWGKRAPASPAAARTDAGVHALNRVTVFQDWARRNDVSLDPAFELREVDADVRGERYRSIVFPTFLLAEYRDGALVCVTPHHTDGCVRTVADRIARIERGTASEYDAVQRASDDRWVSSRIEPDPDPEPVVSE